MGIYDAERSVRAASKVKDGCAKALTTRRAVGGCLLPNVIMDLVASSFPSDALPIAKLVRQQE